MCSIERMAKMEEKRLTATKIAEIVAAALEVQDEDKDNLHHRIRYLAKKRYLIGGQKIDNRGTLDFPASQVYRAAILCEFLAFSMDVKVAAAALTQADANFHPRVENYPNSARQDGGWTFLDCLGTVLRGIKTGEDWWLVVELRRSGTSEGAGLVGRYAHADEQKIDVDAIFGRAPVATVLKVNLTRLYGKILEKL